MKKVFRHIFVFLLFLMIITLGSCDGNITDDNVDLSDVEQSVHISDDIIPVELKENESNFEIPTISPTEATAISDNNDTNKYSSTLLAYRIFLENFQAESVINCFALRDLDGDGIPELLIIQQDGTALNAVLSVYSYAETVYKIGDYSNTGKSFKSVLRFSNNRIFPGLFDFWWGGGIEHYAYLTIKEGKLVSEYLWYEDRTVEPPQKNEIS